MDEAQVVVLFQDESGVTQYRTFSIDVGPYDTYNTIENRLSEIVEDYIGGQLDWTPMEHQFDPVVDPHLGLVYEVINWPDFA